MWVLFSSAEDRAENIRRVGELSKLFLEANLITLVSFISPYECVSSPFFNKVNFLELHFSLTSMLQYISSFSHSSLFLELRADRQLARTLVGPERFIEVYMKIPLSVCESRDPKGLYKLARAGKIKGFTGKFHPFLGEIQMKE